MQGAGVRRVGREGGFVEDPGVSVVAAGPGAVGGGALRGERHGNNQREERGASHHVPHTERSAK